MVAKKKRFVYFERDIQPVTPIDLVHCQIHDETFMCVMEACEGKSFPSRLWHLLSEFHDLNSYIHWSRDGNHVIIPCEVYFYEKVLRRSNNKIFKTSSMNSFLRQLNLYGFRKIKMGNDALFFDKEKNAWPEIVFQHPDFKRGRPELLDKIKRRCNVKKSLDEGKKKELLQQSDHSPPYLVSNSDQFADFIARLVPHEDYLNSDNFHLQLFHSEQKRPVIRGVSATINEFFEGQSFPYRLFYLVSESHHFENVIEWSQDEKSIEIPSQQNFLNKVLNRQNNKIFKTESMKSFVRQLNLYGFRKVQVDKQQSYMREKQTWPEAVFAHPFFRKGRIDLLENVKRRVQVKLKNPCQREFIYYPHITVSQPNEVLPFVGFSGQAEQFSFPQFFPGLDSQIECSEPPSPSGSVYDANSASALQMVLQSFCAELFQACEQMNTEE